MKLHKYNDSVYMFLCKLETIYKYMIFLSAGDNVKFNLPMAYSTWVLGWGMLKFKDGYQAAGNLDMACDMLKWPLDYFLKCWIPSENTLYVQVGVKSYS